MTARLRDRVAAGQLDLFAPDLNPDAGRLVDALTCIRDAVPEAMDMLIHLTHGRARDERGIGMSGDWAYSVRRNGFHYGWNRTLTAHATWQELDSLLGNHPLRPRVLAWAAGLPDPSWRDRIRPHELWPNPGQWNPGYITNDHERPGWAQRIAAWADLQTICTTTIADLAAGR